MALFQASGVAVVNGRAAADVLISFAVGSRFASTIGRTTPPPVRTDKLGRSGAGRVRRGRGLFRHRQRNGRDVPTGESSVDYGSGSGSVRGHGGDV